MKSQSAEAKPNRPNDASNPGFNGWQNETPLTIGTDYKVSYFIVVGRILVTKTYGFASSKYIENYIELLLKIMNEGLEKDKAYVHVMDWSALKGGNLEARNKIVAFLQSQSQLKGLVLCGASSLMRMSARITKKLFSGLPQTQFSSNVDRGIQLAGNMLGLNLREDSDHHPVPLKKKRSSDKTLQLPDTPATAGNNFYMRRLSNYHRLECKKFGNGILLYQIKGSTAANSTDMDKVLQERHRVAQHCIGGHTRHVEIWDSANFDVLFGSSGTHKFFKRLLENAHTLLGCIILDTGHRIRMEAHHHSWGRSTPFPVRILTSLTAALLQAQTFQLNAGSAPHLESPQIETRSDWAYDDGHYRIKNEIVDDDILHTYCRGTLSVLHSESSVELVRPLADKVAGHSEHYYIIMGIGALSGGGYRARKTFATALRQLYSDHPFQMFVFYGAKGTLLTGINILRHKLPFGILLTDDFQSALSAIQVDKYIKAHLASTGKQILDTPPQQRPKTLKHYADDILHYLGTINWEPYAKPSKADPVEPSHPFAQVFDAIDLIKDDLATLYAEQQKAAREQLELEAQLARSRKMEALGLMAGGVAHDLNNVLTGIVTYPDMLLMEVPKNSNLHEPLGRIRDSGQKAAAIVNDLLTLARRGVNHATTLNFNTLIEEYICSPEHQSLAERYPDISISTAQAPDLMNIRGSAVHLKKTIMNLVYNAYEASGTKNKVELVTENRYVEHPFKGYDTVAAGDYAIIHVIDHGTGIAQEDLPRIFEPFYTKKKMGRSGTGLGMAVVWGTVQDHKGQIDVQTSPGEGTTFSLYFPACREKIATMTIEEDRPALSGYGEHILVVDDEGEQRNIATAVLGMLNYRATAVDSGEAALAYLQMEKVDLVLLDMVMEPGMDGLETLKRIYEHHGNLPVIIATGYAEDDRIEEVCKLNGGHLIRKPYTVQPLSEALYEAMHNPV